LIESKLLWIIVIFEQDEWTALTIASTYGRLEIASLLIENKAEVNVKDKVRYDVRDKKQSIRKRNLQWSMVYSEKYR